MCVRVVVIWVSIRVDVCACGFDMDECKGGQPPLPSSHTHPLGWMCVRVVVVWMSVRVDVCAQGFDMDESMGGGVCVSLWYG